MEGPLTIRSHERRIEHLIEIKKAIQYFQKLPSCSGNKDIKYNVEVLRQLGQMFKSHALEMPTETQEIPLALEQLWHLYSTYDAEVAADEPAYGELCNSVRNYVTTAYGDGAALAVDPPRVTQGTWHMGQSTLGAPDQIAAGDLDIDNMSIDKLSLFGLERSCIAAITLISTMQPSNRPASLSSLARILARRLANLRLKEALPVKVLAGAMIPYLQDVPDLLRVIKSFAAGTAPDADFVLVAGKKAALRLRNLQQPFESLPLGAKVQFLHSHAFLTLPVDVQALIEKLQQMHVMQVDPLSQRLTYNEEFVAPPLPLAEPELRLPSMPSSWNIHHMAGFVSLGRGEFGAQLAQSLALSTCDGLKVRTEQWKRAALKEPPLLMYPASVKGTLTKLEINCEWRVQLAVQVIGESSRDLLRAFTKKVLEAACEDMEQVTKNVLVEGCYIASSDQASVDKTWTCPYCEITSCWLNSVCMDCNSDRPEDVCPETDCKEQKWVGVLESRLSCNLMPLPASGAIRVKVRDDAPVDTIERIIKLVAGSKPCFSCALPEHLLKIVTSSDEARHQIETYLKKLQFRHNVVLTLESKLCGHIVGRPSAWAVPDVRKVEGGAQAALLKVFERLQSAEQAVNAFLKRDIIPGNGSLHVESAEEMLETVSVSLGRTVSSKQRSAKAIQDAEMKIQQMQIPRCVAESCSKRELQIARADPRHIKQAKDERMLKAVAVKRAKKLQDKDRERKRDGKYLDQEDSFEEFPADGKKSRHQFHHQSTSRSTRKQMGAGERAGKAQEEPPEVQLFTGGARGSKDAVELKIESALSAGHVASVWALLDQRIVDLKQVLESCTLVPVWRQQFLREDGVMLEDHKTLTDAGLVSGSKILFVKKSWTLVCHATWKLFGPTQWSLPIAEVQALAQTATCVRIQTKGKPEEAVVSKPNTYPIEDLRSGRAIGSGRALKVEEVGLFWQSDVPELLDCLWHEQNHDKDLKDAVYCASGHPNGLHWCACFGQGGTGGHAGRVHRCQWDSEAWNNPNGALAYPIRGPLELYVDA